MKDEPIPEIPPTPGDDYNGFDRTLAAYCKLSDPDILSLAYKLSGPIKVLHMTWTRPTLYTEYTQKAQIRLNSCSIPQPTPGGANIQTWNCLPS